MMYGAASVYANEEWALASLRTRVEDLQAENVGLTRENIVLISQCREKSASIRRVKDALLAYQDKFEEHGFKYDIPEILEDNVRARSPKNQSAGPHDEINKGRSTKEQHSMPLISAPLSSSSSSVSSGSSSDSSSLEDNSSVSSNDQRPRNESKSKRKSKKRKHIDGDRTENRRSKQQRHL